MCTCIISFDLEIENPLNGPLGSSISLLQVKCMHQNSLDKVRGC